MIRKTMCFAICFFIMFDICFSAKVEIGKNKEFIVDGKQLFLLMQWLQPQSIMDKSLNIGINTFIGVGDKQTTSNAKEYLNFCQSKGVYAVLDFDETIKDHPALLGWFGRDEPDMPDKKNKPRMPVSDSIKYYQSIKSKDSKHPFFLGLTASFSKKIPGGYKDVSFYKEYKKAGDVTGFDIYPIYGQMAENSLWWVASGVDELRKLMDDEIPVYATIETGAGSMWMAPSRQRHPKPYEVKCEIYMAIVNGAKAICYFTHSWVSSEKIGNPRYTKTVSWNSPDYTGFGVPKDNQEMIKIVNAQIKRLTPVIYSPDINDKVTFEELSGGKINVMVKEYQNKLYVFAVNMKRKAEEVKFTVQGLKKDTKIKVDEENREIAVNIDGEFKDDFTEHAVHIYEIGK